jgi:hypothetical protein
MKTEKLKKLTRLGLISTGALGLLILGISDPMIGSFLIFVGCLIGLAALCAWAWS